MTSFIGRRSAVDAVRALVVAHRLVTLTGAGGCGKSRLAVEVARDLGDGHPDGTFWVDLAPIADPSLLPATVAAAVGVPEPPEPITDALAHHLSSRGALLVLDNCEHLVDAVAALTVALIGACPRVRLLATSRELLGVTGEVRWPVPPLSVPVGNAPIADAEAVRLFVDRAGAAQPGFALDDENAATIAEICRRLDGIPLAIELAAARVRHLGITEIESGLDDRFRLLTGGARTALPRQRTLEASVEWSHALLGPAERIAFRRLGVFPGSFNLDAAEALAGEGMAVAEVFDLVSALVDRSLLQVSGQGGETRYRMLETIRDYARRRLADAGEAEFTRAAHARWCVAFCRRGEACVKSDDEPTWIRLVDAELDNLRAAIDWSIAGNRGYGMEIVGALLLYWLARSEATIGRERLEATLCAPGITRERVAALTALCIVTYRAGDMLAAARFGDEAIATARQLDDPGLLGQALHFRAWVRYWGEAEARQAWADFEEADRLLRSSGNAFLVSLNLALVGWSYVDTSRAVEGRAMLESALAHLPLRGTARANAQFARGWLARLQGRIDDARAHIEEAFALSQDMDDQYIGLMARAVLATLDLDSGHVEDARVHCEIGLPLAIDHRMPGPEASIRFALAMVARAEGDLDRAAAELEAARACTPMTWFAGILRGLQASTALTAGRVEQARSFAEEALEVGREVDSVTATGLACIALAEIARAEGDLQRAENLLHEALDVAAMAEFAPLGRAALDVLAAVTADHGRIDEAARLWATARPGAGDPAVWRVFQRSAAATASGECEPADELGVMSLDEAIAYARRGRGRRRRPARGWDSLTPMEAKVVGLVSEGLTNPQIGERLYISPRTVQTHLAHVFAKLHISTRAELAAAATARSIGLSPREP